MNGTLYDQDQKELAFLTDLQVDQGTVELTVNTSVPQTNSYFTCQSDKDLSRHLFANHTYYIELENGGRYDFTVSGFGVAVFKYNDGFIKVRIKNQGRGPVIDA